MNPDKVDAIIFLSIVALLWVIFPASNIIWGWRKHRLLYTVKWVINALRFVVQAFWALYILTCGLVLLPSVVEWTNSNINSGNFTPHGLMGDLLITSGIPMVWLFSVVVVSFWILFKGTKPLITYNTQEKEWHEEESVTWQYIRTKLHKLTKVLRHTGVYK